MPFDWWDFFAIAEEFSKSPNDEALSRSAISRYYYACHNVARPYFQTAHPHQELWAAFKADPDRGYKQIGAKGDRLRLARNKADYDNTLPPQELTTARMIAISLQQLLKSVTTTGTPNP